MKITFLKSLPLLMALAFCPSLFAATSVVKTCTTTLPGLEPDQSPVPTQIEILSDGSSLSAKVTQSGSSYIDIAQAEEDSVRANLPDADDSSSSPLNLAERYIAHAIQVTTDPDLGNTFSAGFDLTQVRSAKVYTVGQPTNMGSTAIIEAKDEKGAILGSFFGGFMVTPCQ